MRKSKLLLIALIFSFLITQIVYADWIQNYQTGTWEICERTHWKKLKACNEGETEFQLDNLTDFVGYSGEIVFVDLESYLGDWWHWIDEQDVQIHFNFTGANTSVMLTFRFDYVITYWGAMKGRRVSVKTGINETSYGDVFLGKEVGVDQYTSGRPVFIYVQKNGENLNVIINYWRTYELITLIDESIGLTDTWFDNVTMRIHVEHWGIGYFNAFIENENFAYAGTPQKGKSPYVDNVFLQFIYSVAHTVSGVPKWIIDAVDQFSLWTAQFTTILGFVWGGITAMIPFLPLILIFWGIDALTSSIDKGSIQPIGILATTMYNYGVSAIQIIVSVAHAVYSFIHFW